MTQPPLAASSRVLAPASYDCILLAGFGGPEGQDDVIPYLRNVTRGRGIPDERLEEVAHHYRHFGGISPINEQNRALKAALEGEIAARGLSLPVYWGNRFWAPYFTDALRELHADGHRRVLVLVTTAFSSYSGCRAYREDLAEALAETGLAGELVLDKVRQYFDHPGFVGPNVEFVLGGLRQLADAGHGSAPHVMFSTHSIPTAAADASGPREALPGGDPVPLGDAGGWYGAQQRAMCELIMESVSLEYGDVPWSLVFQSRSGPPTQPWLEPDIRDALERLAAEHKPAHVVVVPIGFISDHLEVLYDLDYEAQAKAEALGMRMIRTATVGHQPRFVQMIRELVAERLTDNPQRLALGNIGPSHDVCPVDCCRYEPRRPT